MFLYFLEEGKYIIFIDAPFIFVPFEGFHKLLSNTPTFY